MTPSKNIQENVQEFLYGRNITLYDYCQYVEVLDVKLQDSPNPPLVSLSHIQRDVFRKYEGNPVLHDAIYGKQSIEYSLLDLSKVNKGIRKVLPWKRDEAHNDRLLQIGELLPEPEYLKTRGILYPDNVTTFVVGSAALSFIGFNLLINYVSPHTSLNPEQLALWQKNWGLYAPSIMSFIFAPMFGSLSNRPRFGNLPLDQAKYLDGKVEEFYR
jgi:hypothetical protein